MQQQADSSDLKSTSPTMSGPRGSAKEAPAQTPIADDDNILQEDETTISSKVQQTGRFLVWVLVIAVLVIGRFSVPDNEVSCYKDRVFEALDSANVFINSPGNEVLRSTFQALNSFFIDIVFIITFGYWVLRGNSSRLPITLAIFYITRALIQTIHLSPFPTGWYFMSPGIPSLVVPYGRGSDFFYSGHAGFLVICSREWHKNGKPRVRNFAMFVTAFTILLLLIYRVHYFIDIFTGVFFADYCFIKIDGVKENMDNFFGNKVRRFLQAIDRSVKAKKTTYEEKRLVQP